MTRAVRSSNRTGRKKRGQSSNAGKPFELYYWPTPNGWKVSIMLEECALPYVVRPVDISKGEQFTPQFLAISPNNRMPAIVDPRGPGGRPISVFESGAILQYKGSAAGCSGGNERLARPSGPGRPFARIAIRRPRPARARASDKIFRSCGRDRFRTSV
jgi:glutathione S-transferase